jgi:hypothetical protein
VRLGLRSSRIYDVAQHSNKPSINQLTKAPMERNQANQPTQASKRQNIQEITSALPNTHIHKTNKMLINK